MTLKLLNWSFSQTYSICFSLLIHSVTFFFLHNEIISTQNYIFLFITVYSYLPNRECTASQSLNPFRVCFVIMICCIVHYSSPLFPSQAPLYFMGTPLLAHKLLSKLVLASTDRFILPETWDSILVQLFWL